MSDHEKAILKLLQSDARLSLEAISERLMIDIKEVAATIDRWEQDGTILGYRAVVRDGALQKVRAMIEVSVEPERDSGFDRVAIQISRFPQVTDLMLVSGNYDLLLFVIGEDLQSVPDFVASKLSPMRGVRSTRSHFMLKKYKEAGFQLEEDEKHERLSVTP